MKKFPIILLFLSCIWISCETVTEPSDNFDFGYDYYPISVGNEWVYEVDSFLYSNEGVYKDTAHWYIKERIIDVHDTATTEGEKSYVLERSQSKDQQNWVVKAIWTISKSKTDIKKTEDNLTFIKLVFPAKKGKKWDGNAYIDDTRDIIVFGEPLVIFGDWSYRIDDELSDLTVGDINYDDVLEVREVSETDRLLEYKYSYTYYAKGVGLIKSERIILFDNKSDSGDWKDKADKGFIVNTKLVSHTII